MITGKTESGFDFELDEGSLDDYELLEDICDMDNGDPLKITAIAKRLLGKEQMQALKEHVRNEEGRVSAARVTEEIAQIFSSQSEVKNS